MFFDMELTFSLKYIYWFFRYAIPYLVLLVLMGMTNKRSEVAFDKVKEQEKEMKIILNVMDEAILIESNGRI